MRRRFVQKIVLTLIAGSFMVYISWQRALNPEPLEASWNRPRIIRPSHQSAPANPLLVSNNPPTRETQPIQQSSKCTEEYCKEFLSEADLLRWTRCSKKALSFFGTSGVKAGRCRFMNGTGRYPVALLSHPGSGNTWVRSLLETATGVCTGAIYCDRDLRARGFVGENVIGSSTLVVKSHDSSTPWEGPFCQGKRFCYGAAILVVRDPYEAFIAEWNREVTELLLKLGGATQYQQGHVDVVPTVFFEGAEWDDYIHNQTIEWETRMRRWIVLGDHPLLVVYYEDLRIDALAEVVRMLDFLKVEYKMADVRERLLAADATTFKRKRPENFNPYSTEQKKLVNRCLQKVRLFLAQYSMDDILRVERYLRL